MAEKIAHVALPKEVRLKDGRIAVIDYINKKDSVREFLDFINALVVERAYLKYDKKISYKEEVKWKKSRLELHNKGEGFLLVARVNSRLAGTSGAYREKGKSRNNVCLGIAIAKPYRGAGLGSVLLGLNIKIAKQNLKPNNIYLSVLAPNKCARGLYTKLGFKKFAIFPKWINHYGKYVDQVFMKLD